MVLPQLRSYGERLPCRSLWGKICAYKILGSGRGRRSLSSAQTSSGRDWLLSRHVHKHKNKGPWALPLPNILTPSPTAPSQSVSSQLCLCDTYTPPGVGILEPIMAYGPKEPGCLPKMDSQQTLSPSGQPLCPGSGGPGADL